MSDPDPSPNSSQNEQKDCVYCHQKLDTRQEQQAKYHNKCYVTSQFLPKIIPEELAVLDQLEKILGEPVPIIQEFDWDWDNVSSGYMINSGILIELTETPTITHLRIPGKLLASLPANIVQLKNLVELDLGRNQLSSFPETKGQLVNLGSLLLHENNLLSLPDSIGQLTSLQFLFLSFNKLEKFPDCIRHLINLKVLYVNSNVLHTIPDWIPQLMHLERLFLGENQLTKLPAALGKLPHLQYLDVSGNKGLGDIAKVYQNRGEVEELFQKL